MLSIAEDRKGKDAVSTLTDLCARVVFTITTLIEPIDRQLLYKMLLLCDTLAELSNDCKILNELFVFAVRQSQSVVNSIREEAEECVVAILQNDTFELSEQVIETLVQS